MVFKEIQQNSAQGSIVFICPAFNKNYQACKHAHNQSNQSREMNPEMTAMMELADKNSEGCITDKLTDRMTSKTEGTKRTQVASPDRKNTTCEMKLQ